MTSNYRYINEFSKTFFLLSRCKCLEPMVKSNTCNCPTYLQESFRRTSEVHNYNLRGSNYDFQLPLPKTNFLKRSFSYRGANAWNQRSNQIRDIRDLAKL